MRKILLSILLAGVAASPALAQDQDNGRWHRDHQQSDRGDRGNRGQAHEERQQAREQVREQVRETPQQRWNGNGGGGGNAQQYQRVAPQAEQRQQWQGRGNFGGQRWNGGDAARQQQVVQQQQQQVVVQQQRQAFDRRNRGGNDGQRQQWQGRGGYAGTYGGQVQGQQWQGRNGYTGNYSGQWQGRNGYTGGYQQGVRNQGSRYANNWNRDWRGDRRYDWRRYRDSHRSIFRLGVYLDPFGYGYRSYDIGYQLPPVYYGQQYWIDPAMYDLPVPPPGAMWVRYWNDALLVDSYSGQVIDVLHDFFW